MVVQTSDLRREVGTSANDDDVLGRCLAQARSLVDRYVEHGGDEDDAVPSSILDAAYLMVGADLFNRRKAPNGILNQQYADGDATPIRIGRDPLAGVRPLLAPWIAPTVA